MRHARKILIALTLVLCTLLWSASAAEASTATRTCRPSASSFNSTLAVTYTLGVDDVIVTNVKGSNPYALSTNVISVGDDRRGTVASKSGGSSVTMTTDYPFWKNWGPWVKLVSKYNNTTCTVVFRPV